MSRMLGVVEKRSVKMSEDYVPKIGKIAWVLLKPLAILWQFKKCVEEASVYKRRWI